VDGDEPALAVELEVGCGLADELGVADALGEGLVAGVVAPPAASRRTCRNLSSAVVLTSVTTWLAGFPGTDTLMMLLPWVCTVAPELPVPFTREVMIETASVISCEDGVLPFGVCAIIVTSVPLDRSRPSPILKSLCQ
jgi:hypothetical protein